MTYLEFKNYIEKEWLNYLGADTSKAKIRFIPKQLRNGPVAEGIAVEGICDVRSEEHTSELQSQR